jgi:hypothetical protein
MMTTEEKKKIVNALLEAIDREGINKRLAAKHLNLHPNYITWALNEKYWGGIGGRWERFREWFVSQDKITEFKLPEGEEITEFFKVKESSHVEAPVKEATTKQVEIPKAAKREKKSQKPDKSVKLVLNQAEMKDLAERVLKAEENIKERNRFFLQELEDLRKNIALIDTVCTNVAEMRKDTEIKLAEMSRLVEKILALKEAPVHAEQPVNAKSGPIVIFQRNYYSKA